MTKRKATRQEPEVDIVESTAKVEAVDLVPLQREVQRVFDAVRDVIDADLGDLIRPTGRVVVNVEVRNGSRERRSGTFAYFAEQRWADTKGAGREALHQIAISPYFLGRPVADTVGTFAHEYLHLVATTNGIKDTSRQGRFHNKAFGGLVALTWLLDEGERSKTIGVTTKASEKCKTWTLEELQPDFGTVVKVLEAPNPKKPPTTVRLECPECGFKATVSIKSFDDGFRPLCEGSIHEESHATERLEVVLSSVGL